MTNRKTLIWLFASAVVIEVFWAWYSSQLMDFKMVILSDSKLDQSITEFEIEQGTEIATQKTRTYTNSACTTESEAISPRHKTTLVTTTSCGQYYFLLILVSSAPANTVRRRDIRETWGVDFAIKPRWKTAFLVARTQNQTEVESLLTIEDAFYGDLVRASYYDHYWNQTLKVQMGFEWAARYCNFSFLLKTDDDVFVNTRALIPHLCQPLTPKEKLYMGNLYKSANVYRGGKWKVSFEEYNESHYPDFCPGFGYVLSADVVALFVELFDVVPAFRLDDVYVGMLADKGGVKVIHNEGFIVNPTVVTNCILQDNIMVRHGIFGDCLRKVFSLTSKEKKFLNTVH